VRSLAVVAVLTTVSAAHAAPVDDIAPRSIVFARGTSLVKADAYGRNESVIAALPAERKSVRALRTDSLGSILLADIDGVWSWLPLDGSTKALTDLPCGAGPAQLSVDGSYVFCRAKTGSQVVNLKSGKVTPIDVPTAGARLTGVGNELRLVWADGNGIWSAVPPQRAKPRKVGLEAPLRSLIVSPDGTQGIGVYHDEVYDGPRTKKPGDVLMVFSLDGTAARRKVIQNGVPLEWSHDSRWVLAQNKNYACVMLAAGGQYKCWRNYTAASVSPDGKYVLVFGTPPKVEPKAKPAKGKKGQKKKAPPKKKAAPEVETGETPEGGETEPGGEVDPEEVTDDVALAPPGGPVALYRAEINGAYTKSPKLIARDVAGAAVWIPGPLPPPSAP